MTDDRDLYDLILALRRAQRKYNERIGDEGYVQVDLTISVWDANWRGILKVVTDSDHGFPLDSVERYNTQMPTASSRHIAFPTDGVPDHPREMPCKVSAIAEREVLNEDK